MYQSGNTSHCCRGLRHLALSRNRYASVAYPNTLSQHTIKCKRRANTVPCPYRVCAGRACSDRVQWNHHDERADMHRLAGEANSSDNASMQIEKRSLNQKGENISCYYWNNHKTT